MIVAVPSFCGSSFPSFTSTIFLSVVLHFKALSVALDGITLADISVVSSIFKRMCSSSVAIDSTSIGFTITVKVSVAFADDILMLASPMPTAFNV